MRKFISLLLALAVVFSLGLTVYADGGNLEPNNPNSGAATGDTTNGVTPPDAAFYKKYGTKSGDVFTATEKTPNDKVTFRIEAVDGNPVVTGQKMPVISASDTSGAIIPNDNGTYEIAIGNGYGAIAGGGYGQKVYIEFPSYKVPGIYRYKITETAVTAQGVSKDDGVMYITVLVVYDTSAGAANNALKAMAYVTKASGDATGDKKQEFQNVYKTNTLNVKNEVTGNMASKTQVFKITVDLESAAPVLNDVTIGTGLLTAPVTLGAFSKTAKAAAAADTTEPADTTAQITKAWTAPASPGGQYTAQVTLYLKHDDLCMFEELPVGVTYTVTEDTVHAEPDENMSNPKTGYTITYRNTATGAANATAAPTGTIGDTASWAVVQNAKNTSVATGVILDSAPYVLLLAVAAIGLALFLRRKRANRES